MPNTTQTPDHTTPISSNLEQELAWLANRSQADIEEARRRLVSLTPAPRPLPEGKTLSDVVEGKLRGDETDQQARDALERLS